MLTLPRTKCEKWSNGMRENDQSACEQTGSVPRSGVTRLRLHAYVLAPQVGVETWLGVQVPPTPIPLSRPPLTSPFARTRSDPRRPAPGPGRPESPRSGRCCGNSLLLRFESRVPPKSVWRGAPNRARPSWPSRMYCGRPAPHPPPHTCWSWAGPEPRNFSLPFPPPLLMHCSRRCAVFGASK